MKTDNVLVSREKWEELHQVAKHCYLLAGSDMRPTIIKILSMPDFIQSERDAEVVAEAQHLLEHERWTNDSDNFYTNDVLAVIKTLDGYSRYFSEEEKDDDTKYADTMKENAQAAINALRYRKDGE